MILPDVTVTVFHDDITVACSCLQQQNFEMVFISLLMPAVQQAGPIPRQTVMESLYLSGSCTGW